MTTVLSLDAAARHRAINNLNDRKGWVLRRHQELQTTNTEYNRHVLKDMIDSAENFLSCYNLMFGIKHDELKTHYATTTSDEDIQELVDRINSQIQTLERGN